MLTDIRLKELPKKYEFMYLDFITNFESIDYFAIIWKIRVKKARHILDTGKMIVYNEQSKN